MIEMREELLWEVLKKYVTSDAYPELKNEVVTVNNIIRYRRNAREKAADIRRKAEEEAAKLERASCDHAYKQHHPRMTAEGDSWEECLLCGQEFH